MRLKQPVFNVISVMSSKCLRPVGPPSPGAAACGTCPKKEWPSSVLDSALCHHQHTLTAGSALPRGEGEGKLLSKHSPGLLTAPTSDNPPPAPAEPQRAPDSSPTHQRGMSSIPTHPADTACPGMAGTGAEPPELPPQASAAFGHLQISTGAAGATSVLQYMQKKNQQ